MHGVNNNPAESSSVNKKRYFCNSYASLTAPSARGCPAADDNGGARGAAGGDLF